MRKHFQNDPDESTFTQVIVSLGEMKVTFLDDCYLNDSCVRNFARHRMIMRVFRLWNDFVIVWYICTSMLL